ncbi:MAG: ABC transporter substrate-binding protein, partial [Firmicutes bacterium]|nr:ABC transporter substrate-binding protein [Bacillota bacterium]
YLEAAEKYEDTGRSVAFFHIGSNGKAYVRKSDDYLTSMIELAGGEYVFKDDALDSTSIDMETFFAKAKDADYIIYNSTLGGELGSIDDLLDKSHLLSAFKAVRNNNVWCTDKSMYQESTHLGNMIESFHKVFAGEADELTELPFLYRIQ